MSNKCLELAGGCQERHLGETAKGSEAADTDEVDREVEAECVTSGYHSLFAIGCPRAYLSTGTRTCI